jgi:hypothetical protein
MQQYQLSLQALLHICSFVELVMTPQIGRDPSRLSFLQYYSYLSEMIGSNLAAF